MRRVLAAEKISEIDDPRRLGCHGRRHDVVELRDIATHDPDLAAQRPVRSGRGIDVHAHYFLAALRQERHETAADKAGAAEDQGRHSCSLRSSCPPRRYPGGEPIGNDPLDHGQDCATAERRLHGRHLGGPGNTMSHITTSFWWVRHAPVAHRGRIYGQTDLSCDCSETALFTGLAEKLPRHATWVTSNLRRTHETAAAIVHAGLPGPQPIPGPDAIILPELAEQHFGEWQGLTHEELQASRARDFHRFWHAPAHEVPPGGESFVAVIDRVSRAIHRLIETQSGGDIIAVAHGGTIRAALAL